MKLCGAREVGTAVRRTLNAIIIEYLALRCNWLGTGKELVVSS